MTTDVKPARDKRTPNASDYARFGEALIAVSLASLALKLPFRWVARLMSIERATKDADGRMSPQIVQAVDRASRRLPWRAMCFHQGLATHWMLRRRGLPSRLHYGVGSGENQLTAHVWVSLDGEILIGGAEAASHALVATFPAEMS